MDAEDLEDRRAEGLQTIFVDGAVGLGTLPHAPIFQDVLGNGLHPCVHPQGLAQRLMEFDPVPRREDVGVVEQAQPKPDCVLLGPQTGETPVGVEGVTERELFLLGHVAERLPADGDFPGARAGAPGWGLGDRLTKSRELPPGLPTEALFDLCQAALDARVQGQSRRHGEFT